MTSTEAEKTVAAERADLQETLAKHRALLRGSAARGPRFEPGARWPARRVLRHVIAETAQHAGHADIIRESMDGAESMG